MMVEGMIFRIQQEQHNYSLFVSFAYNMHAAHIIKIRSIVIGSLLPILRFEINAIDLVYSMNTCATRNQFLWIVYLTSQG